MGGSMYCRLEQTSNKQIQTALIVMILSLGMCVSGYSGADPGEKNALDTMKKATAFMMDEVSNRGGFLHFYADDFSGQWGEVAARKSMIWVQDPGTVGVGMMLLDAFELTGDTVYLEYACKTANALVWGQHPAGGWHYFIDFDMTGIRQWYDDVLSKYWGYEEFYHYYGNCTFDDNVTEGATRFLLRLYLITLDPVYRKPLLKALDFILVSQYPNGGWPQRYPLRYDFAHDGKADYTSFHTYNDNVIQGNIRLLLEAWEKLGDVKYKEAAYRGMDFVVLSQMAPPQAGWGQQYDMDMKPAHARSYEPASIMPHQTVRCIRDLESFYMMTGNRKFLGGIPDAIEWLENSYIPEEHKQYKNITHATFYEVGTDRPLYVHREGNSIENGRYWIDYNPKNPIDHYGQQTRVDVEAAKREYERVNALSPAEAMAEYNRKHSRLRPVPKIDPSEAENLIESLDTRGAWVEDIGEHWDVRYYYNLFYGKPEVHLDGIVTGTYIHNMETLMTYVKNLRGITDE